MKAWLASNCVGLGAGLGKMDIFIIPRSNGNSLIVKVTRDGRVWIDDEEEGQPEQGSGFQDIEIDDALAETANTSFDNKNGKLSLETKESFVNLAKKILSL